MRRAFLIASIAAVALAALIGVVLAAAGPDRETQPAARQNGAAAPSADIAGRDVPPPDPLSPLATSIPGCVCHSDDPALVEEHASYRMNQCFGCHGSTPTGQ